MNRRRFLHAAVVSALVTSLRNHRAQAQTSNIPRRVLGRTGEKVSMVGLGGYHLGMQKDEQESIRIIRAALDSGINFLDNCWDYNDGQSEIRMGKALRDGYRQEGFSDDEDRRPHKEGSRRADRGITAPPADRSHRPSAISRGHSRYGSGLVFSPKTAAWKPSLEAKKQGKLRYIGFTGHKSPDIHLKMLETAFAHGFTFDTVQMPLNVMDAHFDSFEKKVLPVLVKHQIGVLGMKSMGDKLILKSKTATPMECLHYAMNLPTSVVITGCDSMEILQQALDAARSFQPMSAVEVSSLLAKTATAAANGEFERYKTSHDFDSTVQNPEWLG